MNKNLLNVEKEFDVEKIVVNNDNVWAYLRKIYFLKHFNKEKNYNSNLKADKRLKKYFFLLKGIRFGFCNWFRSYKYLFFLNIKGRKYNNEVFFENQFQKIIDSLNDQKILCIIRDINHKVKDEKNVKYTSMSLILLLNQIFHKLSFFKKKNINDIKILENINRYLDININYKNEILKFNIQKAFYRGILKIYSPKAIFVLGYSNNQPLITAANELKIKTIELQHGFISKTYHGFEYFLGKKLDKKFFPNILLSYGKYEIDLLKNYKNNFYMNILPIDRPFLEEYKKAEFNSTLEETFSSYDIKVSISAQKTVEKEMGSFISNCAKKDSRIGYFISLRDFDKNFYYDLDLPDNVYLVSDGYSCYDLMQICDIHLSVYSTCFAEANFIEKKVILVNIEGMADEVLEGIELNDSLCIVNNEKDFFNNVYSLPLSVRPIFYNYTLSDINKSELISNIKEVIDND